MIHISFHVDSLGINAIPAAEAQQLANNGTSAFTETNNDEFDDGLRWDEYGNPYIADTTIH